MGLCSVIRLYENHNNVFFRLEIWPGLVTAVDAFEGGIMLNCDISHKVLRTQTVLDLM